MLRVPLRRPSNSMLVALLALFIALDGPVQAAKLIRGSQIKSSTLTSKHVKNRSLKTIDLSRSSIAALRRTPANSVTSASVAEGSLTGADVADRTIATADLAPNSVGPGKVIANAISANELADGAVESGAVADGSLLAKDVARYSETFNADVPSVPAQDCVGINPEGLAPQVRNGDLSRDLIVGSPPSSWPDDLTFTIRKDPATTNRIRIIACNPTAAAVDPPSGLFRYAVLAD